MALNDLVTTKYMPASTTSAPKLRWFALHVSSRKEAPVAADLEGRGYECFLPKYTSVRRWSDRIKELEQPLFPGYLFSRFEFENRRPLLITPGVLQIVGNGRMPVPLDDSEISALRRAVSSGLPRHPWPYLETGIQVRVKQGNLTGLEGILVNFKGNHRVVLSVRLLQRSVALEVDLSCIAPVNRQAVGEPNKVAVRDVVAAPAVG